MKHYKINSKNLFNNSYIKLINKEIIININNLEVAMQRYLPTKKSYNVVFDIGKLNAKILLFDEHLNIKK